MSDHQTPEQTPEPRRRRVMPAGRALVVIVVTLLVWAVLYAPELKRSAEAGDVGTRRTVSLALLDPLVWLTDHTGLTAAANAASRAAGRDPNAEVGGVRPAAAVRVARLDEVGPVAAHGAGHVDVGLGGRLSHQGTDAVEGVDDFRAVVAPGVLLRSASATYEKR